MQELPPNDSVVAGLIYRVFAFSVKYAYLALDSCDSMTLVPSIASFTAPRFVGVGANHLIFRKLYCFNARCCKSTSGRSAVAVCYSMPDLYWNRH